MLYFSYSTARCELHVLYYPFIEPDMRMAKNRKAFKRFFSALSALDKTLKCYNKTSFVRIRCNLSSKSANLVCLMVASEC